MLSLGIQAFASITVSTLHKIRKLNWLFIIMYSYLPNMLSLGSTLRQHKETKLSFKHFVYIFVIVLYCFVPVLCVRCSRVQ